MTSCKQRDKHIVQGGWFAALQSRFLSQSVGGLEIWVSPFNLTVSISLSFKKHTAVKHKPKNTDSSLESWLKQYMIQIRIAKQLCCFKWYFVCLQFNRYVQNLSMMQVEEDAALLKPINWRKLLQQIRLSQLWLSDNLNKSRALPSMQIVLDGSDMVLKGVLYFMQMSACSCTMLLTTAGTSTSALIQAHAVEKACNFSLNVTKSPSRN